jgi:hypothetical protein
MSVIRRSAAITILMMLGLPAAAAAEYRAIELAVRGMD